MGSISDAHYLLHISNHGRGLTPAQIANIAAYKQFQRKIFEQQGAGLGLIIAKTLVELYGGQFTIESIPEQQTDVYLTFVIA